MAKRRIRIKKINKSFQVQKISLVVFLGLLTLFLGSKIITVQEYPHGNKDPQKVLGLLALTNGDRDTEGYESSAETGSYLFDGAGNTGELNYEGGGMNPPPTDEPEEEKPYDYEVCNEDGYCEVKYAPSDPNTEYEDTAEDIDFQESLDTDSSPIEENIEENFQEIFEIVSQIEDKDVKVKKVGGAVAIVRNEVAATISIPLGVDPETNDLVTKTETGVKKINILPDQAVENVLAVSELSKINPPSVPEETVKDSVTVTNIVNLNLRDDVPVYEIDGVKDHKLLGFIPVTTKATVYVSAESGKAVAKKQSILANVTEFLSPEKKKSFK